MPILNDQIEVTAVSSVSEKELEAVELEVLQSIAVEGTGKSPIKSKQLNSELRRVRKREKRRKVARLPLLHSLDYIALLSPGALTVVESAVGALVDITPVTTVPKFISMITAARYSGILLDPSLVCAPDVETIKAEIMKHPRPLIAYTPLTYEGVKMMVALARDTDAQFVGAGSPLEITELQRALLVAPDVELGRSLYSALTSQLPRLGDPLCATITGMIKCGDGPPTPDAIAVQSGLSRRTVERRFVTAGLAPSRLLVAAAQVVRAYSAITRSSLPLRRIANLLGYTTQRAMDCHLRTLLGRTSSELRREPLTCAAAAAVMARKLISHQYEQKNSVVSGTFRSLILLPAS